MAEYVRASGGHVAERVRPEPGSDHEAELDRLAEDPATNWRRVDEPDSEPEPEAPARNASADDWRAYAVAHGMPPDEAGEYSRDKLVRLYLGEKD